MLDGASRILVWPAPVLWAQKPHHLKKLTTKLRNVPSKMGRAFQASLALIQTKRGGDLVRVVDGAVGDSSVHQYSGVQTDKSGWGSCGTGACEQIRQAITAPQSATKHQELIKTATQLADVVETQASECAAIAVSLGVVVLTCDRFWKPCVYLSLDLSRDRIVLRFPDGQR